MQVITRGTHPRSERQKPSIDFNRQAFHEHIYQTPRKESTPVRTSNRLHHAKRQTCPVVFENSHRLHGSPMVDTYSTTVKTSTQAYYDSRKVQQINGFKEQWKILTLQEIQRQRKNKIMEDSGGSNNYSKSGRKLFVSIAKSNRSSASRESRERLSTGPKLKQIGRVNSVLNSLNSRARIVDTVEMQMEQKTCTNRFIC